MEITVAFLQKIQRRDIRKLPSYTQLKGVERQTEIGFDALSHTKNMGKDAPQFHHRGVELLRCAAIAYRRHPYSRNDTLRNSIQKN